jgi:glycosyltransferase involved in cell wall biosynthesis
VRGFANEGGCDTGGRGGVSDGGKKLRIAQISTVGTTVRREGSDSIETLVWLLSRELTAMGHEVTVFAAAGSKVEGQLVETLPGTYGKNGSPDDWQLCEWMTIARAVERSEEFDVMHSHAYLWGLPMGGLAKSPMVHTLHVTPYEDQAKLRSMYPRECVTALTRFQWSGFPGLPAAPVVPHGIDPGQFTLRETAGDYVCYLGRFIADKGPVAAIRLARRAGVKIVLAGPENDYFRAEVLPLVDGKSVIYAGFVAGAARDELLGGARALMYPLVAPEPFGLVMVEAMMCGTPVAAYRLGAVGEVVDDGVTGFAAGSEEELSAALPGVLGLDRRAVRARAEGRFSARRMAEDYVAVYRRVVEARWPR